LGKGLVAQSIVTDKFETVMKNFSGSVIARGTQFDIHFQVVEETAAQWF
jgi:hypothetical protein